MIQKHLEKIIKQDEEIKELFGEDILSLHYSNISQRQVLVEKAKDIINYYKQLFIIKKASGFGDDELINAVKNISAISGLVKFFDLAGVNDTQGIDYRQIFSDLFLDLIKSVNYAVLESRGKYYFSYSFLYDFLFFNEENSNSRNNKFDAKYISLLIKNNKSNILSLYSRKGIDFRFIKIHCLYEQTKLSFVNTFKDKSKTYFEVEVKEGTRKELPNNKTVNYTDIFIKGKKVFINNVVSENSLFVILSNNEYIDEHGSYVGIKYSYQRGSIEVEYGYSHFLTKVQHSITADFSDLNQIMKAEWLRYVSDFLFYTFSPDLIEAFNLIYLRVENTGKFSDREIYFENDFKVKEEDKQICVEKDESIARPEDFFGNNIKNVCAVIGVNGSGKTSIFRMINENPLFEGNYNDDYKKEWGNYFIIYKLGEQYYYHDNYAENDKEIIVPDEIKRSPYVLNSRMYVISNTFNLSNISKNTNSINGTYCIDYTTEQMFKNELKEEPDFKKILEKITSIDYERFNRLNEFMEKYSEEELKKEYKLELIGETDITFSSGEYNRYVIFSRIFDLFYRDLMPNKTEKQIKNVCDKYILFFDEADIYMHPEWQRRLLDDVIRFIDLILEKWNVRKNVILIFSTNSPFLMSDLPKNKINLLGDENVSEDKNTFGQNIYDILSDKFFMPEIGIGEFAKRKIADAIKFTSKEYQIEHEIDDDKEEFVDYVISILGDDMAKAILKERKKCLE